MSDVSGDHICEFTVMFVHAVCIYVDTMGPIVYYVYMLIFTIICRHDLLI